MKDFNEIYERFDIEIANICRALDAELVTVIKDYDKVEGLIYGTNVFLYQIRTTASLEKVKHEVWREMRNTLEAEGFPSRSSVEVYSRYDKEGVAYYIIDTWEIDI